MAVTLFRKSIRKPWTCSGTYSNCVPSVRAFGRRAVAGAGETVPPHVEAGESASTAGDASSSNVGGDGSALTIMGARVYRRQRAEHHRTFKWGVGNKFRMQGANRFTPVHKPHPKEVMVRDDYYESDNPNIFWEELNESWEVSWYEHSKLNARPFPVKKFGVERAKRAAFEFYEELANNGRLGKKPEFESPQPGVFFDYRLQGWVSFFWRGGRPHARSYSASKWGFDGARELALAKQRDPVNGLYHPHHPGGGTPTHLKKLGRGL